MWDLGAGYLLAELALSSGSSPSGVQQAGEGGTGRAPPSHPSSQQNERVPLPPLTYGETVSDCVLSNSRVDVLTPGTSRRGLAWECGCCRGDQLRWFEVLSPDPV